METNKIMDEVLGDTAILNTSYLYSADFKTTFRGFDKAQVTSLMERAADVDKLQASGGGAEEDGGVAKGTARPLRGHGTVPPGGAGQCAEIEEGTIEQARRERSLICEDARLARRPWPMRARCPRPCAMKSITCAPCASA